jgi:hypothetical protein
MSADGFQLRGGRPRKRIRTLYGRVCRVLILRGGWVARRGNFREAPHLGQRATVIRRP